MGDFHMKWVKKGTLFAVGGGSYVGLELLYRGRSHISMFAAGGICFLLLGSLNRKLRSLPAKAAAGTLAITGVELATGLLVNRNFTVWDYRHQPYNFLGQICPQFMALWLPLSVAAMGLYRLLDSALEIGAG